MSIHCCLNYRHTISESDVLLRLSFVSHTCSRSRSFSLFYLQLAPPSKLLLTATCKQKQTCFPTWAIDSRPFMRDEMTMLFYPKDTSCLNGKGHMISGCKFTKGMNAAQVLITIMEAFDRKIPPDVDIEIMMSKHKKLVPPSLAPGQLGIDGAILQRLFQTKPIYVHPSKQILATTDLVGEEVRFYN